MDSIMTILPWALIIIGALITFLAKPVLIRKNGSTQDDGTRSTLDKQIYVVKIIGMWLVILGAVMIFIAGGMYGRQ